MHDSWDRLVVTTWVTKWGAGCGEVVRGSGIPWGWGTGTQWRAGGWVPGVSMGAV
jgi:hypothetical protein